MRAAALALVAAMMLGATAASADEAAPTADEVYLRSGVVFRGHVQEIVPNDHITILIDGSDEPARVLWADVDRVVVATSATTPTNPLPPELHRTAPQLPPFVGPTARVHIDSPSPVILYRHPAGTTSWIKTCTSPCDMLLPLGDTYRVTGNGVAQSGDFPLTGVSPGGVANVEVSPQSVAGEVLGGLVGGAGVLIGYVGLLVTLVGGLSGNDDSDHSLLKGGLIATGIGGLLTLGGVLIFVESAKTDASVTESSARYKRDESHRRDPVWRTASEHTPLPTAQFPILFSHAF